MNKIFLVVLLAVCLVSVQAFVKRDAPANNEDLLEKFKNDIAKLVPDPEILKQQFSNFTSQVAEAVQKITENLKPKETPQQ